MDPYFPSMIRPRNPMDRRATALANLRYMDAAEQSNARRERELNIRDQSAALAARQAMPPPAAQMIADVNTINAGGTPMARPDLASLPPMPAPAPVMQHGGGGGWSGFGRGRRGSDDEDDEGGRIGGRGPVPVNDRLRQWEKEKEKEFGDFFEKPALQNGGMVPAGDVAVVGDKDPKATEVVQALPDGGARVLPAPTVGYLSDGRGVAMSREGPVVYDAPGPLGDRAIVGPYGIGVATRAVGQAPQNPNIIGGDAVDGARRLLENQVVGVMTLPGTTSTQLAPTALPPPSPFAIPQQRAISKPPPFMEESAFDITEAERNPQGRPEGVGQTEWARYNLRFGARDAAAELRTIDAENRADARVRKTAEQAKAEKEEAARRDADNRRAVAKALSGPDSLITSDQARLLEALAANPGASDALLQAILDMNAKEKAAAQAKADAEAKEKASALVGFESLFDPKTGASVPVFVDRAGNKIPVPPGTPITRQEEEGEVTYQFIGGQLWRIAPGKPPKQFGYMLTDSFTGSSHWVESMDDVEDPSRFSMPPAFNPKPTSTSTVGKPPAPISGKSRNGTAFKLEED